MCHSQGTSWTRWTMNINWNLKWKSFYFLFLKNWLGAFSAMSADCVLMCLHSRLACNGLQRSMNWWCVKCNIKWVKQRAYGAIVEDIMITKKQQLQNLSMNKFFHESSREVLVLRMRYCFPVSFFFLFIDLNTFCLSSPKICLCRLTFFFSFDLSPSFSHSRSFSLSFCLNCSFIPAVCVCVRCFFSHFASYSVHLR